MALSKIGVGAAMVILVVAASTNVIMTRPIEAAKKAPLPWQHWSPGNQAFGEGSLVNSTKTLSPTSTTACPCNDDGSGDETREWDKRFLQLGTIVLLALICFTLFILCVCLLRALAIQEFANANRWRQLGSGNVNLPKKCSPQQKIDGRQQSGVDEGGPGNDTERGLQVKL